MLERRASFFSIKYGLRGHLGSRELALFLENRPLQLAEIEFVRGLVSGHSGRLFRRMNFLEAVIR
jgi:hypothetical protein